jgi:hypothetical protein
MSMVDLKKIIALSGQIARQFQPERIILFVESFDIATRMRGKLRGLLKI